MVQRKTGFQGENHSDTYTRLPYFDTFFELLVSSLLCWEKARPRQARSIMRLTEVSKQFYRHRRFYQSTGCRLKRTIHALEAEVASADAWNCEPGLWITSAAVHLVLMLRGAGDIASYF